MEKFDGCNGYPLVIFHGNIVVPFTTTDTDVRDICMECRGFHQKQPIVSSCVLHDDVSHGNQNRRIGHVSSVDISLHFIIVVDTSR